MTKILVWLAGRGFQLVIAFVLVIFVLSSSDKLPDKMAKYRAEAERLESVSATLIKQQKSFEKDATLALTKANEVALALRRANKAVLEDSESKLIQNKKDAEAAILDSDDLFVKAVEGKSDDIITSYKAKYIHLPIIDHALSVIGVRRKNLDLESVRRQLTATIGSYGQAEAKLNNMKTKRDALLKESTLELRYSACKIALLPFACSKVRAYNALSAEIDTAETKLAEQKVIKAKAEVALSKQKYISFSAVRDAMDPNDASKAYSDYALYVREESEDRVPTQINAALDEFGWLAFWIVLVGAGSPFIYKLGVFAIIAPYAGRTAPVRIFASSNPLKGSVSQTAIDVPLNDDIELLVRAGVQSVSSNVRARDIPVLKANMPLTCLAAGLVNLQQLRSDQTDYVSVAAPDGDRGEVMLIEIPAGGAVVLQPRALVGVLKRRSEELKIERTWRIKVLIAWITCQFRFVVFHGPCSLIIQGQRGVCVEDAKSGRMINKRLTLGFDAGLRYGAMRAPSFLPYLRGEQSLFNDSFTGDGYYLYEQQPSVGGKSSIYGRGLKGLGDTVLSAFGI